MKRLLLTIGATSAIVLAAAACGPPAQIGNPANCGQTTDGTAVVALAVDATTCTRLPGQKLVIVAEKCGPLMPGTNVEDDCYRGFRASDLAFDNFRLGSLDKSRGYTFVASDATAA